MAEPGDQSEAEAAEAGADRILTVPNLVTTVRLLCVPLFLYLLFWADPPHRVAAAYLLAALGATDWVDGYTARHWHQVSTVGKVLDPTADRILLATAVVAILIDHAIPSWLAVAAIARELLVAAAALTLAAAGARRIDVTWVGKAGTFALMFSFPLFLGAHAPDLWWRHEAKFLAYAWGIPGILLSYYAAATYIPIARTALKEGRVGSET